MTSIAHLPVELILDIVGYLGPQIPSMDTNEGLMDRCKIVQRWAEAPDGIFEEKRKDAQAEAPNESRKAVLNRSAYWDLRSLRGANRYFNNLCVPIIYAELDILPQQAAIDNALAVLSSYPDYVSTLNVIVPKEYQDISRIYEYHRVLIEALDVCRHISGLRVYYAPVLQWGYEPIPAYKKLITRLSNKLTSIITQSSLLYLGIGSLHVVRRGYAPAVDAPLGITSLLGSLVPLLGDAPSLRHLELASETIGADMYNDIRAKVSHIHSLTFGGCIDHRLEKLWSFKYASKWTSNANLTHLRLVRCQSAYAPHIPELVLHFSALKYLLVTTCGHFGDVETGTRKPGWSRDSEALWRRRAPLDIFQFEHMVDWEILAMGTIPAKTVIATTIPDGHLGRSFVMDPELFPCIVLLHTEERYIGEEVRMLDARDVDEGQWQEQLSRNRGVVIKADARWVVTEYMLD